MKHYPETFRSAFKAGIVPANDSAYDPPELDALTTDDLADLNLCALWDDDMSVQDYANSLEWH